jgi:pimeloyl-ACP methyl ester carboxylesterase
MRHRTAATLIAVVIALAVLVPSASAAKRKLLTWTDCGGGYQCSTLKVPRDYSRPHGAQFTLAIIRLPAREERRGALFVNFGGPGGEAVSTIHAIGGDLFGAVNDHFDIVGVDPRGVGQTSPSVSCDVDQETQGIYSQPFPTPLTVDRDALIAKDEAYVQRCRDLNGSVLKYITTRNTARDMDRVRAAMGDDQLNYFGFSYGTFLGATYASLFPGRYRAMVIDGPVDANSYANTPTANLREQSAGFERAYGRFFQACAANQAFCGFGGEDPWSAFDQLVATANMHPIPAGGDDPRPIDGDDLLWAVSNDVYAKQYWPEIAEMLRDAANGDGTLVRELVDLFYAGSGNDRYFLITAADQRYPRDVDFYFDAGDHGWGLFDHTYWNTGYPELNYGLLHLQSDHPFRGPFRAAASSPTLLEVATTYDPATPYPGALRLAKQLGNVRLLTMRGDGHTAYGGNSQCIDDAVNAYIETLALPPTGTVCNQEVPFGPSAAPATAQAHAEAVLRRVVRR